MRELKRKKLDARFAQFEKWFEESAEFRESGSLMLDMKAEYEAEVLGVTVPLVRLKDFLNNDYPFLMPDPQRLRDELMEDLSPIVQPTDSAGVGPALEKLVDKINEMQLYAPWQVSSDRPPKSTPELDEIMRNAPSGLFKLKEPEKLAKGPILKLGSGKFVVHNRFDFDLDEHPTERTDFYTIMIRTLTDGTFHQLKRCKECPRFFIADRLSDRFCRPECSEAFFSRDASNRVRASRAKKKREAERRPTRSQRKQRRKVGPKAKAARRPRKRP